MHELQLHEASSFVNLTYDNEHVPVSLEHRDFQLFMKRLRFARRPTKISYYMCGEYGDRTYRPHFHAILFGIGFSDKTYYQKSPAGHDLYTSKELHRYWTAGNATIGEVTFESAAYVARYVLKKQDKNKNERKGERIDADSGEIYEVKREYARMSLNPAIGKNWIKKFHNEVYPNDYVISRATKAKPPRYYDNYLKRTQPDLHETVTLQRKANALTRKDDNTPERLAVKEIVATAATALKKRNLE